MGMLGQQFGSPSGALGRLVGRFMARNNAALNRRVVDAVAALVPPPRVVAELGYGPGVGLAALSAAFPDARVVGADPSTALVSQALARNRSALQAGRLRLVQGDVSALTEEAPLDLVIAVHVLYFWHQPVRTLEAIAGLLRPGGHVALGYQLKQHMPRVAQRDFAVEGHRLYESDDEVGALLVEAGLNVDHRLVIGRVKSPTGRLVVGSRR